MILDIIGCSYSIVSYTMCDIPFGLNNTGAICWLNSLLQSLLSVDHFYNLILFDDNDNDTDNNKLYQELQKLIFEQQYKKIGSVSTKSSDILKHLNIKFAVGQQSSSEGLIYLLDELNSEPINNAFTHIYEERVICNQNDEVVSRTRSKNNIFYIFDEVLLQNSSLKDYILRHSSNLEKYEHKDYNQGHTFTREYNLRRLPEIVVVALNRYHNRNHNISLPGIMIFPHIDGSEMTYSKVAEIDQMGGLGGGHYVCRARRGTQIFLFNDASISISQLNTLSSTYLTFYQREKK